MGDFGLLEVLIAVIIFYALFTKYNAGVLQCIYEDYQ